MTKFESKPAQADKKIEPGSYAQALYAIHHDQGVAENVFARKAKTDFKDGLTGIKYNLVAGNTEVFPVYVEQHTVAVDVKTVPTSPTDETLPRLAGPLESMVVRLTDSVRKTYDRTPISLLGALEVRVRNLGNRKFSFTVKQRWTTVELPDE